MVKKPLTNVETWFQSLGWEDPLEKEMVTHSNTLALETPWTEESGGLPSMWSQRVGRDSVTKPSPQRSLKGKGSVTHPSIQSD